MINKTFNKMHDQNKMKWSLQLISFNFFCFVIWRNHSTDRKGKMMMNIKKLNKIIEADIYSFLIQTDIIDFVIEYEYIFIVNAIDWFHQFLIQRDDWFKFTVISHRNQKQFNVVLMNFKNSLFYVQRQTDKLFRSFKTFIKAYVNDIIIFSKILHEHIEHLR